MTAMAAAAATGGPIVRITDAACNDSVFAPSSSSAGYTLTNAGKAQRNLTSGTTDIENWVNPTSAAGANYEVRATLNSGTLAGGSSATGSWLSLGTTRTWTVTQSGVGINNADLTIEIRSAASAVVLDSATVTLQARVN